MSTPSETGPQAVQDYLRADEPHGWMLLVNPFRRIEGATALLLGLVVIVASVLLGLKGGVAYFGVADVNAGMVDVRTLRPLPASLVGLMPLVDWLIAAAILGLAGRSFSRSRQRLVDYLGMLAVARLPLAIIGVLMLPALMGKQLEQITRWMVQNPQLVTQQLLQFTGPRWFEAVSVLVMVWTGLLTYSALREASGMSRARVLWVFLGAALVAELVSKLAIELMARGALGF